MAGWLRPSRVPSGVQQLPHGRVGPVPRAPAPGIAEGGEGRALPQEERAELAVPLLGGLGGHLRHPRGDTETPEPPHIYTLWEENPRASHPNWAGGSPPCPPTHFMQCHGQGGHPKTPTPPYG